MTYKEKVIKGVHDARRYLEDREWVDKSVGVHIDALNDAIAILKEHEPALPTWSQGRAYCGKCGQRFPRKSADREINYCSYCGKAVKWE